MKMRVRGVILGGSHGGMEKVGGAITGKFYYYIRMFWGVFYAHLC